jgi:hypothetical protein
VTALTKGIIYLSMQQKEVLKRFVISAQDLRNDDDDD